MFIILVSNLKEISPSVFSWKKNNKKLRCNSTVKIQFGRGKILNYAYVLNPLFCVIFVYNPWVFLFVPCVFSSTNNFAYAQMLYRMSSLCRSYECMNIARVNIGVLTGWTKIKQWRISFVLGYLRMILWKISTAISIKHRILATFNIKKKLNSNSL
jgi:hypothetical protein